MPPDYRRTVHIRLSPDLIRQIKITAAEAGQSMNAEIEARLERSFGPEDADRRAAVKLLTDALAVLKYGSRSV